MSLRNWSANESMVYWIARAMGHAKPSRELAQKIANKFTFDQLDRIYRAVKSQQLRDARLLVDLIRPDTNTLLIRKAA